MPLKRSLSVPAYAGLLKGGFGLVAAAAEPAPLGHVRVGEHRAGRVAGRHRRHGDQTGTERSAP